MKQTEQDSIQVKNLIFSSNFSKIGKFPVISSNGTALQWKNWYFSVISVKMNNFPLKTTDRYKI